MLTEQKESRCQWDKKSVNAIGTKEALIPPPTPKKEEEKERKTRKAVQMSEQTLIMQTALPYILCALEST